MDYTPNEAKSLDLLAEAWNVFIADSGGHPSDREEFCRAIHAAQNIIMARLAPRVRPDLHSNHEAPR